MLSNSQSLLEIRNLPFKKLCHFFDHLQKINEWDYLISKLIWFNQKPLEAILDTRIKDFVNDKEVNISILLDISPYLYRIIKNKLQKDNPKLKDICIAPPSGLSSILKELIEEDSSIADLLIFQTRTGKYVSYTQPLRSMRTASELAQIGFTITP